MVAVYVLNAIPPQNKRSGSDQSGIEAKQGRTQRIIAADNRRIGVNPYAAGRIRRIIHVEGESGFVPLRATSEEIEIIGVQGKKQGVERGAGERNQCRWIRTCIAMI